MKENAQVGGTVQEKSKPPGSEFHKLHIFENSQSKNDNNNKEQRKSHQVSASIKELIQFLQARQLETLHLRLNL